MDRWVFLAKEGRKNAHIRVSDARVRMQHDFPWSFSNTKVADSICRVTRDWLRDCLRDLLVGVVNLEGADA